MNEVIKIAAGKFFVKIPVGLFYSEHDTWVKRGSEVVIGITDFFQLTLGDVLFITLPEEGSEIVTVEEIGEIESIKAVLEICSPVNGKVLKVNPKLEENPEFLNNDPYGEGWLLRVEPSDLEADLSKLMNAEQYAKLVENKVKEEQERAERQRAEL
ncbi:MAG: glycine cleavage system protein GcvH [Candidatus Lokiarchaeia archaeon]